MGGYNTAVKIDSLMSLTTGNYNSVFGDASASTLNMETVTLLSEQNKAKSLFFGTTHASSSTQTTDQ